MTRRRSSSLRVRCAQMLGTAALVGVTFPAIGVSADTVAHWLGMR